MCDTGTRMRPLIAWLGIVGAVAMFAAVAVWALVELTTPSTRRMGTVMPKPMEENELTQRLPPEALIACETFRAKAGKDRVAEAKAIILALARLDPRQPKYCWEDVKPEPPVTLPELVDLLGRPDETAPHDPTGYHGSDDPPGMDEFPAVLYICGPPNRSSLFTWLPPPQIVVLLEPESAVVARIHFNEFTPRP